MADKDVVALTVATSIGTSDLLYAVIGGNSRKITRDNALKNITALAIGSATIGANALAVTGTSLFNNSITMAPATAVRIAAGSYVSVITGGIEVGNNVEVGVARVWSQSGGLGVVNVGSAGMFGWGPDNVVSSSVDTGISRNAAGVTQFSTTTANAFGAWLAAKGTLTAGGTLSFASGTNQRAGNATLVGGTVTVSNTTVTANTVVILTRKTSGGTIGTAITYTLSAGVSFTINSDSVIDTSTFSYVLLEVP